MASHAGEVAIVVQKLAIVFDARTATAAWAMPRR